MRKSIILFTILQSIHCSCPSGFELVRSGECRGNYAEISAYWDEAEALAIAKCSEVGGQPMIIHSADDQSYWKNRVVGAWPVMGIVCNSNSKLWEWVNGSIIDYKPPSGQYNALLDQACISGVSWAMKPDGFWANNNVHDEMRAYDVFCQTQLQRSSPSADGCESFEDDSDDGVRYQIGKTAENWQEAQEICRSFGADLASIHNSKENSFVRRLAVSKGEVQGVFLGATISGKDNEYGWMDGTDWDYDNFYPGFPMSDLGNCVAMDTQGVTGEWVNTDCDSKLSVACVRPQNYTTPACSAGPWREGDIIYSPGFPFDASTPCDYIFTVDAGKRVQVEVLLLEANSCCDHLLIYDNYIAGNLIADLTGEVTDRTFTTNSSNFMRVSWQPNGGINVRGAMFTFRGV